MIQEQFVEAESQLSRADFVQLTELLVALDPFTAASALMEGELYVTISMVIPIWKQLETEATEKVTQLNKLREERKVEGRITGELAKRLWKQLQFREQKDGWGFSNAAKIAAFLDPRWRDLSQFFDDEECAEMYSLVRIEMAKERGRVAREQKRDESSASSAAKSDAKDGKDNKEPKSDKDAKDRDDNSGKDEKEKSKPGKRPAEAIGPSDEPAVVKKQKLLDRAVARFCKKSEGEESLASEFERYRNYVDPGINASSFDLLSWWRVNSNRFPFLARVARRFLAVPATSAPAERVWSTAGNLVDDSRARLRDDNIEALVMCHQNFATLLSKVKRELPDFGDELVWVTAEQSKTPAAAGVMTAFGAGLFGSRPMKMFTIQRRRAFGCVDFGPICRSRDAWSLMTSPGQSLNSRDRAFGFKCQ